MDILTNPGTPCLGFFICKRNLLPTGSASSTALAFGSESNPRLEQVRLRASRVVG